MQVNLVVILGEFCVVFFLWVYWFVEFGKQDKMKNGVVVILFGLGGSYCGVLLVFFLLGEDSVVVFFKVVSGKLVLVILKQGNMKLVILNVVYFEVKVSGFLFLVFLVLSIEVLMKGMQDNWSFEIVFDGKFVVSVVWYDGLMVCSEFRKCLDGQFFDMVWYWKD